MIYVNGLGKLAWRFGWTKARKVDQQAPTINMKNGLKSLHGLSHYPTASDFYSLESFLDAK